MTLIEVLMILAALLLLAVVLLPSIARPRRPHGYPASCFNQLKQIGIASFIWAGDHGDKYPMLVSTNAGGTKEFVGSTPDTFRHFEVMSNELNTPKILLCPSDRDSSRKMASTFADFRSNFNLSYFVGIDGDNREPQRFLTGDRNLTNGTPIIRGMLTLTTNHPPGWTDEMHKQQGNVGLADGSVQGLSTTALQTALANTGLETNRLAMP